MTETPDSTPDSAAPKKRAGGLSSMLLADLKSMAAGMGIPGAGSMKKAQLVEAIKGAQESSRAAAAARQEARQASSDAPQQDAPRQGAPRNDALRNDALRNDSEQQAERVQGDQPRESQSRDRQERDEQAQGERQQDGQEQQESRRQRNRQQRGQQDGAKDGQKDGRGDRDQSEKHDKQSDKGQSDKGQSDKGQSDKAQSDKQGGRNKQGGGGNQGQQNQGGQNQQSKQGNQGNQGQQHGNQHDSDVDDDGEDGGSRRNRRRRGRDRNLNRPGRGEPDTSILEDDVLVPAAGILDVLDNYAFVRTSGYLPGADDVYLSLSMVRKYGLRRGDAVVGQVRQPREGERREKFNPMVRIDSVNGADPEASKERPHFADGTPIHPDERLRLSTDADNIIGKVIDIVTPIGKGQRGLIYAPPASGTTPLMRSIATSVTTNNPECHVMVVLVDERPEEVTDYQRSVKGEVIASTFDREPADHVMVAELSIERAKRLVELGHDVVVLLDSITRLGRAYNLLAPANGRVLAAGVDASAIHPPKQFFGAARNLEDGGSLTILATVSDSGAAIDELFVEELAGTSNLELRLTRERAALGLTPAVDPSVSATRHEELLLAPAESAVVGDVRRKLAEATTQAALVKVVSGVR